MEKVTVCVLAHNVEATVKETISSACNQNYPNLEILVLENGSTDQTIEVIKEIEDKRVVLASEKRDLGLNGNMDRAKDLASGEYIIFMSGDDIFADTRVVRKIANVFRVYPKVGHVSRWYYQFIHGLKGAVRVNRAKNIYNLADNPSGLAFRKLAICGVTSGKSFIEAASMVKNVLDSGWEYYVIEEDLVAVRLGFNGASTPAAYKESPTLSWINLVGKQDFLLKNHIGFIQLKNWAPYKLLLSEVWLHVRLRPLNLITPSFWLFGSIAVFTPRCILREITKFYKHRITRHFLNNPLGGRFW